MCQQAKFTGRKEMGSLPGHSLGTVLGTRYHLAESCAELSSGRDGAPGILGQLLGNGLAYRAGQAWSVPVSADHNLQRPVTVHTAEIEVALGWHIGDVGRDTAFFAELPDLGRSRGVINGYQHHLGSMKIGRLKAPVHEGDLSLCHTICHLGAKACRR
jgi:hypothetical protein